MAFDRIAGSCAHFDVICSRGLSVDTKNLIYKEDIVLFSLKGSVHANRLEGWLLVLNYLYQV